MHYRMLQWNRKPFLPMYNPIIFLKRDYNVPKENIRKIWDFQRKGVKWIPEKFRFFIEYEPYSYN